MILSFHKYLNYRRCGCIVEWSLVEDKWEKRSPWSFWLHPELRSDRSHFTIISYYFNLGNFIIKTSPKRAIRLHTSPIFLGWAQPWTGQRQMPCKISNKLSVKKCVPTNMYNFRNILNLSLSIKHRLVVFTGVNTYS